MARFNVYVADDLKRRMDKVPDISWSQVACEAFERKLGELAARKKEKSMTDVIQRLRASKMESDSEISAKGRKHGYEWAKSKAKAAELKRLDTYLARISPDADSAFIVSEGNAYSGAEVFAFAIRPDSDGDRGAAHDFWSGVQFGENDTPEDEYVQGFAAGALDLWSEVADKL